MTLLGFIGDDRGPEPLPRQRIIVFHMCWAALVPAFCYVFMADAPMVFVLALPLALFSLAKKRSYRLSNRAKVYSFVIPLVFSSLFDLVYKVDMNHFFMSVSTLCPLLIFYALSVSLLDQRPETLVTCMACALGAMLVQGLTLSPPDMKRIVPPHPMFLNRFRLFIIAVLAQSYSILHLPKMAVMIHKDTRTETVNRQLTRAGLTVFATVLVFGVAIAFSFSAIKAYRFLDPFFSDSYRDFLHKRSRKVMFQDRISTDATLAWKLDKYGEQAALFVQSDVAPGYVRGRSYTRYRNGMWTAERLREGTWSSASSDALPLVAGTGGLSINTWMADGQNKEELNSADVYFANRFKPGELYLPGNTSGLELITDRLSVTPDGIFIASGWDETTGYRYFTTETDQSAAYPYPDTPEGGYLEVPDELFPVAYMHASMAVADDATDEEKVLGVVAYLQNNFEYSLTPKIPCPEDGEPVVHFLRTSRQGHCELFASSAVAMLRSLGIKSRYVTGFVCFEELPGGGHVARFKNCHAWAEAWIPGEGWRWVEPTPASGVPAPATNAGVSALGESVQNWFTHMLAGIKRGYFAKTVIDGFFAFLNILDAVFLSVYGILAWPLLIVIATLGINRIRRKRLPKVSHPYARLFMELRDSLISFLQKHGVAYHPHMSLREIAATVPSEGEFGKLLAEYEQLRYNPATAEADLEEFTKRFSDWTRNRATTDN